MIRNETYEAGRCIEADCYDLDTRIYQREEHGVVTVTRPMTDDEWFRYGPQPLNDIGAIAALNVVLGIWPIEDAANIAGVTPDQLRTEAQGWAAAKNRRR